MFQSWLFAIFQLIHPGKQPHKATQTDAEVASLSCNCDVRYAKIFSDFKERIEDSHKEEKEKALKELEERVSVTVKCVLIEDVCSKPALSNHLWDNAETSVKMDGIESTPYILFREKGSECAETWLANSWS